MTEQEREEFRQFNGRTIEELYKLSDEILKSYSINGKLAAEPRVAGIRKSLWDEMERQRDYWE